MDSFCSVRDCAEEYPEQIGDGFLYEGRRRNVRIKESFVTLKLTDAHLSKAGRARSASTVGGCVSMSALSTPSVGLRPGSGTENIVESLRLASGSSHSETILGTDRNVKPSLAQLSEKGRSFP